MTPNEFFLKEQYKELEFICNGIEYYRISNSGIPTYFQRLQAFQNRMQDHEEFKLTGAEINEAIGMIKSFNNNKSLTEVERVFEVNRIVGNFEHRREQNNKIQLLYDVASIWYFTAEEDPSVYEYEYAKKHIKNWLQNNEAILPDGTKTKLSDFFLQTPMNRFVDLQNWYDFDTQQYSKKLMELGYSHSLYNLSKLTQEEKTSNLGESIGWLMEMYSLFWQLNDSELSNTSPT